MRNWLSILYYPTIKIILWKTNMNHHVLKIPFKPADIAQLVELFGKTFQYYCHHPGKISRVDAQGFLTHLNTVVGLSLTTILAQQDLIAVIRKLVNRYLRYYPFYQHPKKSKLLASTVVDLVCCGTDLLQDIGKAYYGHDLLRALEQCIMHMKIIILASVQ